MFKKILTVLFPVLTNTAWKWNKLQSHQIGRERPAQAHNHGTGLKLGMFAQYLLSCVTLPWSPGSLALPGPVGMLTKSFNQVYHLRISALGHVMSVHICVSVSLPPHQKYFSGKLLISTPPTFISSHAVDHENFSCLS